MTNVIITYIEKKFKHDNVNRSGKKFVLILARYARDRIYKKIIITYLLWKNTTPQRENQEKTYAIKPYNA